MQNLKPKSILIIEDDRDIRESLSELLEIEGYQVNTASNGQDGIEFLQKSDATLPHLILLDLMMPIKDGFQFRKEQNENLRWAKIPTVLMSADGGVQKKLEQFGDKAYLKKPVEFDHLIETVKHHCI